MATIAERIRTGLDVRGMKQSELVEKTSIGKSSISTYLSGQYEPKQKNIYKIAKALSVSEAWLMGQDVPMERTLPYNFDESDLLVVKMAAVTHLSKLLEVDSRDIVDSLLKLNKEGLTEIVLRINEFAQIPKYKTEKRAEILNVIRANEYEVIEREEVVYRPNTSDSIMAFPSREVSEVEIRGYMAAGHGVENYDKSHPVKTVTLGRVPADYDLAFEVRGNSMYPTFENGEIIFVKKTEHVNYGMIAAVEINSEAFIKKIYLEENGMRLTSLNKDVDEKGNRLYPDFYAEEYDDFHLIGKVIN